MREKSIVFFDGEEGATYFSLGLFVGRNVDLEKCPLPLDESLLQTNDETKQRGELKQPTYLECLCPIVERVDHQSLQFLGDSLVNLTLGD